MRRRSLPLALLFGLSCGRGGFETLPVDSESRSAEPVDRTGTGGTGGGTGNDGGNVPTPEPTGPFSSIRSIGKGVLPEVNATGQVGDTFIETDAAVAELRSGDRLVVADGEYFVASVAGTRVNLQSSLLVELAGERVVLSRAYANVVEWEADTEGDLVAGDRREVGVLYADSPFVGAEAEVTIEGAITDASRYRVLRPAAEAFHSGRAGGGVVFDGTDEFIVFDVREDYFRLSGVEIRGFGAGAPAGGDAAVRVGARDVHLDQLLIHSPSDSGAFGIRGPPDSIAPTSAYLTNSLIWGVNIGVQVEAASVSFLVENTTIYESGAAGLRRLNSGALTARNVISMGSGTDDDFVGEITQDHNVSSDASAAGPGAIPSADPAAVFRSITPGSFDLRLRPGSPAIDSGVLPDRAPGRDVEGEDRPSSEYDIGADEFTG